MCLAVPGKVIEVDADEAVVELHGNRVRICTLLTPGVRAGGWVLMHAGFAIQTLETEQAARTWGVLEDLEERTVTDESREVLR